MKPRGFTLIELLVVISIIGMLSSVVLASMNTARVKARDAARLAGLQEIQNALELYYSTNGSYPVVQGYLTPSSNVNWTTGLGVSLAPYLKQLPTDYSTGGFLYSSTNGGQKYGLATGLDSSSHTTLMANDGGRYSGYYEMGPSPAECQAVNKDWWGGTATNCP